MEEIASLPVSVRPRSSPSRSRVSARPSPRRLANGVVVCVEVLFRHDSERADDGKRVAVLAIQFVHTVAIASTIALRHHGVDGTRGVEDGPGFGVARTGQL